MKNLRKKAKRPGKAEHFLNFEKYSERKKIKEKEIKPQMNRKFSKREHMKTHCSEINEPHLKEKVNSLGKLKNSVKQKQLVVKTPTNIFNLLKDYEPKIGQTEDSVENRRSEADCHKITKKRKQKREAHQKSTRKNVNKNVSNHGSKIFEGNLNVRR